VQVVVDSLNERFLDLLVFNASKLFSTKYFPIEEETYINMCEQWSKRFTLKFKLSKVQKDASKGELLKIVKTLMYECENKSLCQA
jgi:hypothetical protein